MNFNFSSFLNGSMRFLNIANKAIPLLKEFNPAYKNIKNTMTKFTNVNPKLKTKKVLLPPIEKRNNNTLTFFR